jgi:hypothetical protein
MRHSTILFAILILGSLTSNAQLKIGLTGGIDYSKTNIRRLYRNDFGVQGKATFHFGLTSEFKLADKVFLATDILFSRKGFQQPTIQEVTANDPQLYKVFDVDVSADYIEMPVIPEFKVKFEKMKVLFGVGPYIAYGVGGKINMKIASGTNTNSFSTNIFWKKFDGNRNGDINKTIAYNLGQANIQHFDYGPIVRLGIEIHSITVNAEYEYGLSNLMYEWSANESMHNQRLGLSVKYTFAQLKKQ